MINQFVDSTDPKDLKVSWTSVNLFVVDYKYFGYHSFQNL